MPLVRSFYLLGFFFIFEEKDRMIVQIKREREKKIERILSMKHLLLVERSLCILFLEGEEKNRGFRRIGLLFFLDDIPGATRTSCFFVRIRKKTSSLVGSISRIAERALSERDLINAAYC